MKRFLVTGLLALAALFQMLGIVTAEERYVCKVGRPAYCDKYHGVCRQQGGPACDAWRKACFDCHEASATCTAGIKTKAQKPDCDRCKTTWSACMAQTYVAHWPAKAEPKAK